MLSSSLREGIDQTSVRTKGTVVVFDLTRLNTKEYIFNTASLLSHRLDRGSWSGGYDGESADHV
jgi:hypothetical protein